jgi:hypothetical protein
MRDLRELKQHVLTFEKNYQSRFPESRRLYNEISHEYVARVQTALAAGGRWGDAYHWTADGAVGGYRGARDAAKWTADKATRGYRGARDAAEWTADKAARGYIGARDAAEWTADKAGKGYRRTKNAYDWTADNVGKGYNWTADKLGKGWRGAKSAHNWAADTASWFVGETSALLDKLRAEADNMYNKAKRLKNRGKQAVCRSAKRRCNMITVEKCEKSKAKLLEKLSKSVEKQKVESLKDRIEERGSKSPPLRRSKIIAKK